MTAYLCLSYTVRYNVLLHLKFDCSVVDIYETMLVFVAGVSVSVLEKYWVIYVKQWEDEKIKSVFSKIV